MARNLINGNGPAGAANSSGHAADAAASQTATAATAATAQAMQAAATARHAQDSFVKAAAAFQAIQSTQAAARAAAFAATSTVHDGLGAGGLNPLGGLPSTLSGGSAIQVIQLGSGGKGQVSLGSSGSVTLPNGTPGSDQIALTGAGTVTTAGGTVTTTAGSVMTTTGGTLATTSGGTISLTAGNGTLTATTNTTITSTLAGTVNLPAGGGTVALAAGQSANIPAGSTISFTGTSAGSVSVTGTGTVALTGAGTLALAGATASSKGGTITTGSGTTTFSNGGVVSSLPAGSQINLLGSGTISLTGTTDGSSVTTLPVIVPSSSSGTGASAFNFTTTGTVLSTQSFNLPTSWSGVGALSESKSTSGAVTDTITQTSPEALLYWSSFNIGRNTALDFDQSAGGVNAGSWVAINQIVNDPSLAPSQILGAIQAPGQVYVINQNGIIFGGSSQVNTHALVASSLPINTNLTSPENLLGGSSTQNQFLFSQLSVAKLAVSGSTTILPAFTPPAAPAGGDGDVIVEPGAQLTSPTTAEHVGGKIALLGPVVKNEGTISTPDGQTILAAGLQVGFTPHDQTDSTLRGVDVFVGQVGTASNKSGVADGTVTNDGIIDSPRADITMAGRYVDQNGIIASLTSVTLNGRIDLLADYNARVTLNPTSQTIYAPSASGTVTLGANSITEILPDATGDTIVATSLATPSLVNIEGQSIHFAGNGSSQGAQLLAPGAAAVASNAAALTDGTVDLTGASLTSGVNISAGSWSTSGAVAFSPTTGQITLDGGTNLDVSGSQDVAASVEENIVAAQLRGTELADSPLQQTGPLRGKTVDIDIRQSGVYNGVAWIGSPIGDLAGYAGLVQHTVNELTVNGGTVSLQAGTSVNIAAGSTINVSGGWINYQGGTVQTTNVVTAGGQTLNIAQATPDQIYQGIEAGNTVTSPKWGVSQTTNVSNTAVFEQGYTQGGNGGALTISTPSLALQGGLYGNTVAGAQQVKPVQQVQVTLTSSNGSGVPETVSGLSPFAKATFTANSNTPNNNFMTQILLPIDAVPATSSLILNLSSASSSSAPIDVVIQPGTGPRLANPFAGAGNMELDLSADLVNVDGFGNLSIGGNGFSSSNYNSSVLLPQVSMTGNIALPAGVSLSTQTGGTVDLAAVNIEVEGSISSPGGSISVLTQNLLPSSTTNVNGPLQASAGRGDFTLGSHASLSTAGLIVNNGPHSATANTLPQVINGGSVSIQSLNANLHMGGSIDASGGVLINNKGASAYGAAGKIDIEAGRDTGTGGTYAIVGGQLNLGATLTAYSGATGGGGSLTLIAPAIQVGGSSLQNGDTTGTPVIENSLAWGNGTTLWLDRTGSADFFSAGGFSTFSITGLGLSPITYTGGIATTIDPYASTPGVFIAPNTTIHPLVQSYSQIVDTNGIELTPITQSFASQRTPVNLTFNASGVSATAFQPALLVVRGDLVMSAGSLIETDPLGSVTLKGQTATVLGQVIVPGGNITVTGASESKNLFNANTSALTSAADISPTVDLGSQSVLSTAGVAASTFNAFGFNTGTVLNGGTITVSGNIVAEQNSLLNVSGTSGTFDLSPVITGVAASSFIRQRMVATTETSGGGTITFTGHEELFDDATLLGAAGGAGAQPGSLSISNSFSNYNPSSPNAQIVQNPLDASLIVTQSGLTRDPSQTGQAVIGQPITPTNPATDVDGNAILGYFAADTNIFSSTVLDSSATNNGGKAGGIGSLTMNGTVQFSGPVAITTSNKISVGSIQGLANLSTLSGGIIYADSAVTLNSAYVQLGLPFGGPAGSNPALLPSTGSGSLSVTASKLIDVGNLQTENIHQLTLNTPGDVRGDGTLYVAENISITAGQIYPGTETTFTIAALDSGSNSATVSIFNAGGSLPGLPLSAGGTLNIFADTITQDGILRAPMGTINLGSITPPTNLPTTTSLTLGSHSVTSVSAIDPNTGLGITIPYGSIDSNGNWIDPAGNTITAGSTPTLPAKAINIAAASVTDVSGSTLDIRGGGDLSAGQFIQGTGGLNDILGSTSSFSIVPSVDQLSYAPFSTVTGYATSSYGNLQVGDQINLSGGSGLAAGTYTLLPSRYATLPGAFLITPKSGTPVGAAVTEADGSVLVSGQRTSSLTGASEQTVPSMFEIDSRSVINSRAAYSVASANAFFPQSAASLNVVSPRLPIDAGQVVFNATQSLAIPNTSGALLAQPGTGGLGSIVDISSSSTTAINIYNSADPTNVPVAGDLNLDANALDSFGADSLLIGGFRTVTSTGIQVTVATESLTVNNAGAALTGPDIILVSSGSLTVDPNAIIASSPHSAVAAPLLHLTGNNVVLRVSSDANARIVRSGFTAGTTGPNLTIGAGATIGTTQAADGSFSAGSGSVILDSTSAAFLDPQSVLSASSVSLNAGQITLVLSTLDTPITTALPGLVISSTTLGKLQSTAQNFSLLSYTSLDIWGSGSIGDSPDATGQYQVKSLTLHTADIRGFDNGGKAVDINAQNVVLDNAPNGTGLGPVAGSTAQGTLAIQAQTVMLGVNPVAIDQFTQVTLAASDKILLSNGAGSLAVSGNLILSTPLLTSAPIAPLTPLQELNGLAAPQATVQTISAHGSLTLQNPGGTVPNVAEGLGAKVTLAGTSVRANSNVELPSGALTIVATNGDVNVGGNLDAGGTSESIFSLTQYTPGGQINLSSYTGSVLLNQGSMVNVSAPSAGGNAGSVAISAPAGTFTFAGSNIKGEGGAGGAGGTFTLDVGSLANANLSPLEQALNPVVTGAVTGDVYLGGFTQAQNIRVRTGNVTLDGITATDAFDLSADNGSITIGTANGGGEIASNGGTIDVNGQATASIDVSTHANGNGDKVLANPGVIGGSIALNANGSVTLLAGSLLSVAAQTVNDAGQGGTVTLEAGDETNGVAPSTATSRDGATSQFGAGVAVVDIQSRSVIELSVAQTTRILDGSVITGAAGTLMLRAPQTDANTDVQINPINGAVINPSSIVIEGYQIFNATADGSIDNQETAVMNNGNTFAGVAGQPATAAYSSMLSAILPGNGVNASLQNSTVIEPGAEIINTNLDTVTAPTAGDLTLASNWDLSSFRFGPNNVAGDLALRAGGNLVIDFGASLSDGFSENPNPSLSQYGLWSDILMTSGPSWSYRLISGADFGAADYHQVLPMNQTNPLLASAPDALTANSGSLVVGLNTPFENFEDSQTQGTTAAIMSSFGGGLGFFQTIRTGTGNIDIASGHDVQLLNNVATIYTAGSQVQPAAGFDVPVLNDPTVNNNNNYNYPAIGGTIGNAQYSQTGGNITISAAGDIAHYRNFDPTTGLTQVATDIEGNPLMADSSKELPTNWLYRRGFASGSIFGTNVDGQVASTTWWIDFSNFFEGVGALGGGNVRVKAGGNISNVDVSVPTNAYLSQDAAGDPLAPTAGVLNELGGGDLTLHAGNNLDGGVYYVERGNANLFAGNSVITNPTRNVVSTTASPANDLPITFYLGKGSIDIAAQDNLLLGQTVNAFLQPQGINNTVNDKSYFSTYAATDSVTASSLTGVVTVQDAFSPAVATDSNLVNFYIQQVSFGGQNSFSFSSPWLGLVESNITPFENVLSLMPPTLNVTSFSGDIDLEGNLTLSPSPVGTINLAAAGSINAFQPIAVGATGILASGSSQINLSDANPNSIPGVTTPLSYAPSAQLRITLATTNISLFNPINNLFTVSGSTTGNFALLATQQRLHADLPIDPSDPNSSLGPLHANDPTPIHIYAATGDVDGLNLFSSKFADVVAGNDIANISLYIQNINPSDISLVEAGRDIVAFDTSSRLREETHLAGGIYFDENDDFTNPSSFLPNGAAQGAPNAGDIQISGPGTLEVLAGRNLTLGDGPSNGDGTGLGIVSIGNTTNPFLSFNGADIVGAAGLGGSIPNGASPNLGTSAFGLDPTANSSLAFTNPAGTGFIDQFLNPNTQAKGEADRYLPMLGSLLGVDGASATQIWSIFNNAPDTSLNSTQLAVQAKLTPENRDTLATTIFYDVLRDSGRDHNSPTSPDIGTYNEGLAAISALFPSSHSYQGDISLTAREIKTTNVGNISLLAPGGGVDVGLNNSGAQAIDQGILTVSGGDISIFTNQNVAVGTSRIFTLHGGNIIIFSTNGNIAAGASSKTVQSAPPTRVLIDPASGNVETDLAGLATGGGIGVLETVAGAPPGNVDLIAPNGVVDAGDAGIRSSGNINIAAATVLNAGNIQSGGSTSGVASAPSVNIGATVAASSAAGSSQNAAAEAGRPQSPNQSQQPDMPSLISVEVIGYSADDSASNDTSPYPAVASSNSH